MSVSHQAVVLGWGEEGGGRSCRFWLVFREEDFLGRC
nr:MAG TPA: cathepsin L [Caudoviricetes sp.]